MAPAAARFYGDPTATLQMVGVTGTNGKTTTAFLVRALLEADGRQTGLLGTVKSVIGGVEHEVERTTPEAIDLQRTFREMLDAGDVACAMEVSSHALELHRADAIHFAAAIFTNLTQDHLDFHPTMEDYFAAKRRLFIEPRPRARGRQRRRSVRRAARRRARPTPITFALDAAGRPTAATSVETDLGRLALHASRRPTASSSCARRCAAASTSTTCSARSPPRARSASPRETASQALATAGQVPGRFETVDEGQEFAVARRLRPHARLARERAGRGRARADRRPAARRVRLRRRPRPRQAAADGRDRRAGSPTA